MIYDLDDVAVSQRIYDTWVLMAGENIKMILKKYPDLKEKEIPDEQFRVLPSGIGQIFIEIREKTISLNVPKNEYDIR